MIVAINFVLLSIVVIKLFANCVVPTHGPIATMLSIINGSCPVYILAIIFSSEITLYVTNSILVYLLITVSISFLLHISC